jgi:hypothetical protein
MSSSSPSTSASLLTSTSSAAPSTSTSLATLLTSTLRSAPSTSPSMTAPPSSPPSNASWDAPCTSPSTQLVASSTISLTSPSGPPLSALSAALCASLNVSPLAAQIILPSFNSTSLSNPVSSAPDQLELSLKLLATSADGRSLRLENITDLLNQDVSILSMEAIIGAGKSTLIDALRISRYPGDPGTSRNLDHQWPRRICPLVILPKHEQIGDDLPSVGGADTFPEPSQRNDFCQRHPLRGARTIDLVGQSDIRCPAASGREYDRPGIVPLL